LNTWQLLSVVKAKLVAATWATSPNDFVFGTVKVSAGPQRSGIERCRFPWLVIAPGNSSADRLEPKLLQQTLNFRLAAKVAGDAWGEAALMGGPEGVTGGNSKGKGLLQIEEAMLVVIQDLQEKDSIRIRQVAQSAVQPVEVEELGYVVIRDYVMEAWTSTEQSVVP
jgi:hypothetical protein